MRSAGSSGPGVSRRPARGTTRPIVISRDLSAAAFFPDRTATVVATTMDFYWPAGTQTAAAGNYFSVYPNSCFQPFGTNYQITAAPGSAFANHATLVQGDALTNGPMGISSLAILYTNYRVRKYRFEITVVPQSSTDTCRLVVVSMGGEEIPTAAGESLRIMESQPYAMSKTCAVSVVGGPGNNNTLNYYGEPAKDLGKKTYEYMALPDTLIGATPAAGVLDSIGVFTQQLNGANNAGVVTCQIKLYQYAEFYDLVQQIN